MSTLSLELLGPFHAAVDGEPLLKFRTNKAQAILIYLAAEEALSRGAPVRREQLLGLLWPDYPEQSARQSLRTNLSYLRSSLAAVEGDGTEGPPFLLADNQSLQLNPAVP
jgi:DNA-binding SARP family transcriptional activator